MGLRFVLLALLSKETNTGYGLGRVLRTQANHLWEARLQQIYSELSMLEGQGMIETESFDLPNRPAKKVCSITPKGLQSLDEWLKEPSAPVPSKDELLVRLFCLDRIPADILTRRLEETLDQAEARVRELKGKLEDAHRNPKAELGYVLGLEAGAIRAEGHASWCAKALAAVRDANAGAPPAR